MNETINWHKLYRLGLKEKPTKAKKSEQSTKETTILKRISGFNMARKV